jgi:Carboxypeptidase regulatory-like domain
MRQRSLLCKRLAFVALASLVMSACGGGGGGGVAPPPVTGVSGAVTNSRGGPGVSGATVTATSSMASATTNSQGGYVLALNPGPYDILAAAPGMAASKFQGVTVVANKSTTANLIMFPIFNPSLTVGAPTIAVANLPQNVSGNVTFTVTVTTAAATLSVRRIDVRASNFNAAPLSTGALSSGEAVDVSSAMFTLTSTALSNGPAFVDVIAYDMNQNAAELMVSFTVNNAGSGTAPATPTGLSLVAVTTGESFGLFSTQRAQLFSTLSIRQDPRILRVGGRSISILSAPSNSTLFVEPQWNAVTGATGYKVFRSFSGGGPFVQVAQVPPTQVTTGGALFYDDADPSLGPGVPVFYQVSAFNAVGESAPTAALGVTPLSAFNLNLASPANNSTNVSSTPLFTWAPTASVGTDQFYDIVVWGLNDPSPAWQTNNFAFADTTSITYATPVSGGTVSVNPLQSGKVYQWDIYEAAAQTVYSFSPLSFAIAPATVPNPQGLVPTSRAGGSLNGPFKFTTGF